jgi:hypothetical protein
METGWIPGSRAAADDDMGTSFAKDGGAAARLAGGIQPGPSLRNQTAFRITDPICFK